MPAKRNPPNRPRPLSLYPLKFDDVIGAVVKVKPEQRSDRDKPKARAKRPGRESNSYKKDN